MNLGNVSGYYYFHPTPIASESVQEIVRLSSSVTTSTEKCLEMISSIDEIANECSVEDWDGEGSKAVEPKVVSQVKQFVEFLPEHVARPSIFPRGDGSLALQWTKNKNQALLITFNGTLEIQVATISLTKRTSGPTAWGYGQIPGDLRSDLLRFSELH